MTAPIRNPPGADCQVIIGQLFCCLWPLHLSRLSHSSYGWTSHESRKSPGLHSERWYHIRSQKSEVRSRKSESVFCPLSSVIYPLPTARRTGHEKADDSPCCACYSAKRCEARAAQQSRKGRLAAEEKEYCIEEGTTRPELCQSRKGPLSGGRTGERAADVHCIGSRGSCKRKG